MNHCYKGVRVRVLSPDRGRSRQYISSKALTRAAGVWKQCGERKSQDHEGSK
jgi:hypothetical protein